MKTELQIIEEETKPIFDEIKTIINTTRTRVYTSVNVEMLNMNWSIGKRIMEVQEGKLRAKYGNQVLKKYRKYSLMNLGKVSQFKI